MSTVVTTKDRSQALMITVGFHILVVLIFLFIKYKIPAQLQTEEYGMEVNLGNSEDGFGDDQPEDPNPPSEQNAASANMLHQNQDEDNSKDVHTDDHASDDAVAVHKPKAPIKTAKELKTEEPKQTNKAPKPTNTNTTTTTTTPKERTSRFDVKGGLNDGTNGNSAQNTKPGGAQGDGTGNGDKGVPGGNPNSTNYAGRGGNGTTGINHSFKNREIVAWPENTAEFNKGGSVKVEVRVDKSGKVTILGTSGSTDPSLNALARQKAAKIKFNQAGPNDPIEQKGTIIINFKVGK